VWTQHAHRKANKGGHGNIMIVVQRVEHQPKLLQITENIPVPEVLLQEERPRVAVRCWFRGELSSISIDFFMWRLFYRSMGLYKTTVTYLDSNLWVTPRATSGWPPQPFSMKRWLRTMCWGRAHTSSECCELSTPR